MTRMTSGKKSSDKMRLLNLNLEMSSLGEELNHFPSTLLVTSVKLYSRSCPRPLIASMIRLGSTNRVVSMCNSWPSILESGISRISISSLEVRVLYVDYEDIGPI